VFLTFCYIDMSLMSHCLSIFPFFLNLFYLVSKFKKWFLGMVKLIMLYPRMQTCSEIKWNKTTQEKKMKIIFAHEFIDLIMFSWNFIGLDYMKKWQYYTKKYSCGTSKNHLIIWNHLLNQPFIIDNISY